MLTNQMKIFATLISYIKIVVKSKLDLASDAVRRGGVAQGRRAAGHRGGRGQRERGAFPASAPRSRRERRLRRLARGRGRRAGDRFGRGRGLDHHRADWAAGPGGQE